MLMSMSNVPDIGPIPGAWIKIRIQHYHPQEAQPLVKKVNTWRQLDGKHSVVKLKTQVTTGAQQVGI